MTYPRAVTARLLDTDASTVISGALDQSFGRSFMRELSGYGYGSCSLPHDDANILQLRRGRYVQILIAGTVRFSFRIAGAPRYQQIGEGEEMEQFVTVEGPGWGDMFDRVAVRPEGALNLPLDYSYRLFSFASMFFPNASAWGAAVERYEYHDGISYGARVDSQLDPGTDPDDPADDVLVLYPAPIMFPWPNAEKNGNTFAPTPVYDPTYWVTADGAPSEESIGFHFFRGSFELAGQQAVTFFVTGDNLYTLFLDGVPILGEKGDALAWKYWKDVTLELPAGDHVVAAVVENIDADVTYNPAGLLLNAIAVAVYPGDVDTSLTLSMLSSSAADLPDSFFSADEWPGWTAGQIMIQLIDESVANGRLSVFDTVGGITFAAFADTDANDWDTEDTDTTLEFIPVFSIALGKTLGDVLRQLRDQGWAEWRFQMSTPTLDMWTPGLVGAASGVTFAHGTNIRSLERGETKPYANALLIQYEEGFTEYEDTAEITANGGVIEDDIFVTDAATEYEALRQGRIEINRRKQDERVAVLMVVEPTSAADCPFEAFEEGDYVDQPQVDGTGTDNVQVHAIHVDEDENGNAIFKLETGARWRAPALESAETLRNIGGKSLGTPQVHGAARE